jgi:TRAP-type C4-dicarboxylate transport system permease large subunit
MNLWGFISAAVLLTLMPGPDILFVITQSITRGRKAGMVFAAGISVMLATVLLYVPGIFVYAKGQKEKGLKVFETKVDKAVFVALLALLVICIYFVGTGRINPLG